MAQYVRQTFAVGAKPTVWPLDGTVIANVAYRETAGVACTLILRGPDGDSIDNVAANGLGLAHKKALSLIEVTGNGATLVVDARGPEEWIDPENLTATISGTVTTTVSNTVNTDFGQSTAPANIVNNTSGLIVSAFANGGTPTSPGFIHYVLIGTGAQPKVTVGANTVNLNGGNVLGNNVGLVGSFPVDTSATVTVAGATVQTLNFYVSVS